MLNSNMNNKFVIKYYSQKITRNAKQTDAAFFSVSLDRYTPIGCVGWSTNHTDLKVLSVIFSTESKVRMDIVNQSSSIINADCGVNVLFLLNS